MEVPYDFGEEMALLTEVNHRLFNTLQIISSSISQCRRDLRDRADLTSLPDLKTRLAALSRMHRLLSTPTPRAGLEDHCRSLCILLTQAFGREDVTPWVTMDDLSLSPKQAYSLPLLVVELVTNVLKHSLVEQANGIVWVDLHTRGGQIGLTVTDNRKAPLSAFAPSRIVTILVRRLRGEAFVQRHEAWTAGARMPTDAASVNAICAHGARHWRAAV
jgi:two-component sensor histidine kinase